MDKVDMFNKVKKYNIIVKPFSLITKLILKSARAMNKNQKTMCIQFKD